MAFQFLCPNGHKIRCSEDREGKPAKCPRCGVKFRVPQPSEPGAPQQDSAGNDRPSSTHLESLSIEDSPETAGVAAGPATAEDQIEFLCPNNHLLHGPVGLQGEAGECPECGSRFAHSVRTDESEEAAPEPISPPNLREPESPPPAPVGESDTQISLQAPRTGGDSRRRSAARARCRLHIAPGERTGTHR